MARYNCELITVSPEVFKNNDFYFYTSSFFMGDYGQTEKKAARDFAV